MNDVSMPIEVVARPITAIVQFVDFPYRFRALVVGHSLVLRGRDADPTQVDVRIWVRSTDWDSGLAGDVSFRRLQNDGRLVTEGRPSALRTLFDALDS